MSLIKHIKHEELWSWCNVVRNEEGSGVHFQISPSAGSEMRKRIAALMNPAKKAFESFFSERKHCSKITVEGKFDDESFQDKSRVLRWVLEGSDLSPRSYPENRDSFGLYLREVFEVFQRANLSVQAFLDN